ncbi:alkyl hydroperoxide reductase subunit C [Candidatus Uzinura diaspidicola str. ASNER]|uniref:Thioredoxin peroxidase n=1 Tax=Candidatus Uzinura diaspidicola str. ASNER TaxID=1133592 RepID=L7VKF5_9FLAO|nr:alkyl hydroperoxide reductase subunit C [Candidatus Uzinura diaspidicola str. ASNER]
MISLVGKKAPNFRANAVISGGNIVNDFSIEKFKDEKYVLLFFYPKDFTFICPTELHAFQEELTEFQKRNVQVIAVSTDTEYSHYGWLQLSKNKGGIKGVTYPIVADTNKTISHNYGILAGEWFYNDEDYLESSGELIAYRGLFIIDKKGIVRHQLVNDFFLGRSINEAIRIVDALQYYENNGEVCPANWQKGKKGMKASIKGVEDYFSNI